MALVQYMIKSISKVIQSHHYGCNDRFMAALVIILDRFDVRQARPRDDFQGATCLAALFHRVETDVVAT